MSRLSDFEHRESRQLLDRLWSEREVTAAASGDRKLLDAWATLGLDTYATNQPAGEV